MTHSGRGILVAVEGIDGSGTTTQVRMLADRLNGSPGDDGQRMRVNRTAEPSAGPIGRLLREVIEAEFEVDAGALALLFAADRLDHYRALIEPTLREGAHVISDRYLHSSLSYQSLNMPEDWVAQINSRAPSPTLAVYLRIDAELAQQRRVLRDQREDLFDGLELQRAVAERYDALMGTSTEQGSWIKSASGEWVRGGADREHFGRRCDVAILDGAASPQEVGAELEALVRAVITATRA